MWYTPAMDAVAGGRRNQKERTRRAIVAAAARLVELGGLPVVPEVAREALVSTATVYRYFPDQLSLLAAALEDSYAGVAERFRPDVTAETDIGRRVDLATEHLLRRIGERETLVRAVVALSLLRSVDGATSREESRRIRPGYRHAWIEEALAPVADRIAPEDLRLLKLSLGVVMGSEALIALQDVMGLESGEAVEVCRWMARTLTAAVVPERERCP